MIRFLQNLHKQARERALQREIEAGCARQRIVREERAAAALRGRRKVRA